MNSMQSIAYWATVELYRTYLFEDGPFLETIRDANGQMAPGTLAKIAYSYSVARTIPAPPGEETKTYNLDLFAERILALSEHWPTTCLIERAEMCRETAKCLAHDFKYRKHDKKIASPRKNEPHSAVTKLIWFLLPNGWTVYDQYVAKAVLKNGGSACDRQKRFYSTIKEPLLKYTQKIKEPLDRFNNNLHPERLIDKYLIFSGMDAVGRKSFMIRNCHFLRLLPEEFNTNLKELGSAIAKELPNGAFAKER